MDPNDPRVKADVMGNVQPKFPVSRGATIDALNSRPLPTVPRPPITAPDIPKAGQGSIFGNESPITAPNASQGLNNAILAAPKSEVQRGLKNEAGKNEFEAEKPGFPTADPFSGDWYKQREAKIQFDKEHPWGSPVSAHPGTLGKIAHGLATAGNIAGDIVAPATMQNIPGTTAHRSLEEAQNAAGFGEASKQELEKAQTFNQRAEGYAKLHPTTIGKTWEDNEYDSLIQQGYTPDQAGEKIANQKNPNNKPGEPKFFNVPGSDNPVEAYPKGGKFFTEDGKELPAGAVPYAKPTEKNPVPGTDATGKRVFGTLNPKTKEWEDSSGKPINGFVPPPNYAEIAPGLLDQRLEAQTKTLVDNNGVAQDYAYDPQTKQYDRYQGISASGQQGSRLYAIGTSIRAGDNLIQDIRANKKDIDNQMGTLSAWVLKHGINVPYVGNPVLAKLQAEMVSYAALQPAQHGFRGGDALERFMNIVGDIQKDPDAAIASIEGLNDQARAASGIPSMENKTESDKGNRNNTDNKDELKPPKEADPGMKWQHRTVNGKVEWKQVKENAQQ
jgi:hypothetical protein